MNNSRFEPNEAINRVATYMIASHKQCKWDNWFIYEKRERKWNLKGIDLYPLELKFDQHMPFHWSVEWSSQKGSDGPLIFCTILYY